MPRASDLTAMPGTLSSPTLGFYLFLAERLFTLACFAQLGFALDFFYSIGRDARYCATQRAPGPGGRGSRSFLAKSL